jgi:tetratricopeptide (TPR) repeat protein
MKTLIGTLVIVFFVNFCFAQDAETLFNNAQKLYENDKVKEAIVEYSKALSVDSEHMNSLLRRGFAYSQTEQYELAVKDFSKIIEMKPTHIWAYTSRGSAYNKLKKYNLAMNDFNKVLMLDPENQEAYNNRGWSKKFTNDQEGACADWKKSRKMGNEEAKIILKNSGCK